MSTSPKNTEVDELKRGLIRAMDELHLARDVAVAAKAYVEEWPPKVSEAHTKLTEAIARWEEPSSTFGYPRDNPTEVRER